MEVNRPRERANWRRCQTHNCSANSSSTCLTDGVVVCNMCAAIFHYDCEVKIKDKEGFVIYALEILKDLVETMRDKGMKNRIDKIKKDFREEITHIQDKIKALEGKIARKKINLSNVDNFVQKSKRLAKSIIESHIYSVYTDYILKLEICGIVPTKLDESGEMGLHGIRTQFYLETKKKERDFCEYKLKALAQEIDARVSQAKQQSDQKFAEFERRLSQEADSTKSKVEKLEQLMLSKLEKMQNKQSSKLEEVNSKVDKQKEKVRKSKRLNEEYKEQLNNKLDQHKEKIKNIEKKQEEIEKEKEITNKNTEKRQTKQDEKTEKLNQKIDELVKGSSKSIKKIEVSIEDTYQKIKTSNEELKKDFKLKIDEVKSSLQKDLSKNQKNCSKLVDCYSEEVKANYSELNQKVDIIQENLMDATEIVNSEIKERKRIEERIKRERKETEVLERKRIQLLEEEKQREIAKIKILKEEEKMRINFEKVKMFEITKNFEKEKHEKQLQLRDQQFYRDKFWNDNIPSLKHPSNDSLRRFESNFANSSGIYNKLGPFKYKPEDFSLPIHLKYDSKYVYVGQFKLANNTLHGIGIRVCIDGDINEGYWKDGVLDGNGRCISGDDGSYYIGTYKSGGYAEGIKHIKDGSIRETFYRF